MANDYPTDWDFEPIGELLERVIDYRGKTPPKAKEGIPTLTAANVKDGRIDLSSVSYVSRETYSRWLTRGIPLPGDVLITTEAPVGEVASLPDDRTYLITRRLMALRGRKGRLDNGYLKYSLLYSGNRQRLLSATRGSTVPRVLKPDILNLPIPVPSYTEQRAIAHILGTLDDKIELNRAMNQTLEEMAGALFKSWFVDFDPVHAKARGEQPPGLDPAIAELFPSGFVETELGLVPEGWRVSRISELIDLKRDSLKPEGFPDELFEYYSIPAFDSGQAEMEQGGQIKSNKYVVYPGSVLLSKLNPRFPRIWMPQVGNTHRSICSTEFFVCLPKGDMRREYLYRLFSSESFLRDFAQMVTGTSGSHQRVNPQSFLAMETVLPNSSLILGLAELVAPMLEKIHQNLDESRTLAELRDTLLPKLMSGELRVPEAEELVKAI